MIGDLKTLCCSIIENRSLDLNDISQSIWKNPELAYKEFHAHEVLTTFLEKEGFKVFPKTPLETAFIARFGDNSGLKIGVLCEYDALPGVGHACGHNLIAEAGIGAALGIKTVLETCDDVKAEVIVFGSPAEEEGGGKIQMIEAGVFDEVAFCLMSHPAPREIPRPVCNACVELTITFHGRPSHAAAAPWLGINALDAAVACYTSISMLRQQTKPTSRVHAVITDGGEKPNIIPERAVLDVYARGLTDEDTLNLTEKVENCAQGAATSAGCTVDIARDKAYYAAVNTNSVLIGLYIENAKSLGVEFHTNDEHFGESFGASTDMGNVSKIKPSIHPFYKIPADGMNHTHIFNEASGQSGSQLPTLNSAKSMAMTALDVLCDGALMEEVRNEFKRSTNQI